MNDVFPHANSNMAPDEQANQGTFVREQWYYALPSIALKPGVMLHRIILGEPVLIGRSENGKAFALSDTCPHRGTLLSRGKFDGHEVQCPYHGWRFSTDGQCTIIPSQTSIQKPQAKDIRTKSYEVSERQGNIWVFIGKGTSNLNSEFPPVPEVPALGDHFQLHVSLRFACNIDLAVIGLMDPAHGAFVHRSKIWRNEDSIHEKRKAFSPLTENEGIGWRMDRHKASSNSKAYKVFLGSAPETEITYRMPSVRTEHAQTKKYEYCGLTACTPVSAYETDVHHVMYWNAPGGILLRPIVRHIARRFLDQDRRAVTAMNEGLSFNPPTMMVQDADTQTRWYYQLKREVLAAQAEKRTPRNTLKPVTLTWRS